VKAGPTARSASCSLEQLFESWGACVLDEAVQQILLQRLTSRRGAPPERGMNVVGHVLDLDAGHAAIVAP
jgi:hypothetical protein